MIEQTSSLQEHSTNLTLIKQMPARQAVCRNIPSWKIVFILTPKQSDNATWDYFLTAQMTRLQDLPSNGKQPLMHRVAIQDFPTTFPSQKLVKILYELQNRAVVHVLSSQVISLNPPCQAGGNSKAVDFTKTPITAEALVERLKEVAEKLLKTKQTLSSLGPNHLFHKKKYEQNKQIREETLQEQEQEQEQLRTLAKVATTKFVSKFNDPKTSEAGKQELIKQMVALAKSSDHSVLHSTIKAFSKAIDGNCEEALLFDGLTQMLQKTAQMNAVDLAAICQEAILESVQKAKGSLNAQAINQVLQSYTLDPEELAVLARSKHLRREIAKSLKKELWKKILANQQVQESCRQFQIDLSTFPDLVETWLEVFADHFDKKLPQQKRFEFTQLVTLVEQLHGVADKLQRNEEELSVAIHRAINATLDLIIDNHFEALTRATKKGLEAPVKKGRAVTTETDTHWNKLKKIFKEETDYPNDTLGFLLAYEQEALSRISSNRNRLGLILDGGPGKALAGLGVAAAGVTILVLAAPVEGAVAGTAAGVTGLAALKDYNKVITAFKGVPKVYGDNYLWTVGTIMSGHRGQLPGAFSTIFSLLLLEAFDHFLAPAEQAELTLFSYGSFRC